MAQAEIDIAILKSSLDLVFDHICNDLRIKKLKISEDDRLYWHVDLLKSFDMDQDPDQYLVGDVLDDYEFLRNMTEKAETSSDAPTLMLEHVAGVLRAIAAKVRG